MDFVDNYDNTMKEPTLLPVTFPSILCNVTTGIAVGMASSIASFNLKEVCDTTIALIKNPAHVIADTLLAPDFVGGGYILYNKPELDKIYDTGRGSVRVRAKYTYDKKYNCIDVTEIPPTTTAEAIIDKIVELVKTNKVREISDIRDETDLTGLKITIDLKRGVHADDLMLRLYKMTPLEDSFSCNFNVLVDGKPKVYGVRELLMAWIDFRLECVRRRLTFMLNKKRDQLHLLKGLSKILLDIDKAIKIVRETKAEVDVVLNLMIGFGIDEIQAEYVAEIKLRHLNREYILKRIQDIENLENEIAQLEEVLSSQNKMKKSNRGRVAGGSPEVRHRPPFGNSLRCAGGCAGDGAGDAGLPGDCVPFCRGVFEEDQDSQPALERRAKSSRRGDTMLREEEASNRDELLFFTNHHQVYKSRLSDFEDGKASQLGEYVAGKLEMEEDEQPVYMALLHEYKGYMLFAFENGKFAKVDVAAYQTKTNRKKLLNAYSAKSPLAAAMYIPEDTEVVLCSDSGRKLLLNTGGVLAKSTKDTIGISAMTLKKNKRSPVCTCTKKASLKSPGATVPKICRQRAHCPRRRTLASS